MAIVWFTTPVDISATQDATWQERDLSSNVPTTATGIIYRVWDEGTGVITKVGVRSADSSTDNFGKNDYPSVITGYSALGTGRKVDVYAGDYDMQHIYLVGYFEGEASFTTDWTSLGQINKTSTWTDLSTGCPVGTKAVILYLKVASASTANWGCRKDGSTDNRQANTYQECGQFLIVGVTNTGTARVVETWCNNVTTAPTMYKVGYITYGVTALTNGSEHAPTSSGSNWYDLSALPADWQGGGFFELPYDATTHQGLRPDGNTNADWSRNEDMWSHPWPGVGAVSNKAEMWYPDGTKDLFLLVFPTFGYEAIAPDLNYSGLDVDFHKTVFAGATGSYTATITVYFTQVAASPNNKGLVGLYNASYNKLAASAEKTGLVVGWNTFTLTSGFSLTNGATYWFALHTPSGNNWTAMVTTTGENQHGWLTRTYDGTMPDYLEPSGTEATLTSVFSAVTVGGTTYYKTLAATEVSTATLAKVLTKVKSLAATAVSSLTLGRVLTRVKSLPATAVSSLTLGKVGTWYRALTATEVSTPTLGKVGTWYRALTATEVSSTTLGKVPTFVRSLLAQAVSSPVLAKVPTFCRSLVAQAASSPTIARAATFSRALVSQAVSSPTVSRAITFGRTLAAAVVSVPGLVAIKLGTTYYKTLEAAAVSVATASRVITYCRSLPAQAVSSPTISRIMTYCRSLPATAASSPTFARVVTFSRSLAATVVGVPGLVAIKLGTTYYKTLAAVAGSAAAIAKAKTILKSLPASATGSVTLGRALTLYRNLTATAVSSPAVGRALTLYRGMVATAQAVPKLTTNTLSAMLDILMHSKPARVMASGARRMLRRLHTFKSGN